MHESVKAALAGFLKQFEGKVNFMYLFMNAAAVKSNRENIAELSWPIRRGTTVVV